MKVVLAAIWLSIKLFKKRLYLNSPLKPNQTCKDFFSGAVITLVCDVSSDQPDFLLVLKATDFSELGRAEIGQIRTTGLHGIFLPQL